MLGEPKFTFYEKVRIQTGNYSQLIGSVMGRSQDDDHNWHYSVQIEGKVSSCMFRESELESIGVVGSREDFYDGSSLRVVVNDRGEGNPVDDAENIPKD